MEKSSSNIEDIEVAVASQSTKAALEDLGWTKGRIFKRRNSEGYPQGYGVFTGQWGFSEDYTLKFTDGREFLHEFCTLVTIADPEVAWFINLEVSSIQEQHNQFMELIHTSYNKIYLKATQK
jgi:hypothetical protein